MAKTITDILNTFTTQLVPLNQKLGLDVGAATAAAQNVGTVTAVQQAKIDSATAEYDQLVGAAKGLSDSANAAVTQDRLDQTSLIEQIRSDLAALETDDGTGTPPPAPPAPSTP